MDREQVKLLIRQINAVYNNPLKDDPKFIIDTWHSVLKDYEFKVITSNLENYIKAGNEFAPKVAQLIKLQKEERDRYIPSVEETRKYLEEQAQLMANNANDPKTQKAKKKAQAEIRALLAQFKAKN